jgi:hypothetical protein
VENPGCGQFNRGAGRNEMWRKYLGSKAQAGHFWFYLVLPSFGCGAWECGMEHLVLPGFTLPNFGAAA